MFFSGIALERIKTKNLRYDRVRRLWMLLEASKLNCQALGVEGGVQEEEPEGEHPAGVEASLVRGVVVGVETEDLGVYLARSDAGTVR
jgi:hypothetical protein